MRRSASIVKPGWLSGGRGFIYLGENGRRISDDINDYLEEQLGEDVSAKDFRTWNASVMAAVSLATDGRDAGL